MTMDIRDCDRIEHGDILALNFIRADAPYVFRRHFRTGLRSRIIEVLDPAAAALERGGVLVDGVRCFPRARPVKMLRIFRTRFADLDRASEETRRLKIVERYLAPDLMAASSEFFVHYRIGGRLQILLCGLQDYVHGVALDPWLVGYPGYLRQLHGRLEDETGAIVPPERFLPRLSASLERFVTQIRQMMDHDRLIPDLAGARNLIVAGDGTLRLVDINNLSRLSFGRPIPLDDKGYPVMDKSIEALELLARHLLGKDELRSDTAFGVFFTPSRQSRVRAAEARFEASLA